MHFIFHVFVNLNDAHFIFKVANHGHNAETCNDASMIFYAEKEVGPFAILNHHNTTLSYIIV